VRNNQADLESQVKSDETAVEATYFAVLKNILPTFISQQTDLTVVGRLGTSLDLSSVHFIFEGGPKVFPSTKIRPQRSRT